MLSANVRILGICMTKIFWYNLIIECWVCVPVEKSLSARSLGKFNDIE
jgi:hypothetical protein